MGTFYGSLNNTLLSQHPYMKLFLKVLLIFLPLVCSAQNWMESYSDAMENAQTEDKQILLVFSGSDWCAPCIKLDRDIWQSKEFQSNANQKFVLYRADFPRRKENRLKEQLVRENKELADRYNPKGYFPLVLVLDKNGKILGQTGYQKTTPKEYITLLNSFGK